MTKRCCITACQALALPLAITLLTLIPYVQVAGFEYINLDDYSYVFFNRHVAEGLSPENVGWALSSCGYGVWMPLTWLSYMADATLFGATPRVFHLVNALLHALNAGLLFVLLRTVLGCEAVWSAALQCRFGSGGLQSDESGRRTEVRREEAAMNRRTPNPAALVAAAALAALFWSLHPLRVEPAAWIASRKDVLSLFWELLALIFWVRQAETGARSRSVRPVAVFLCLSVACFALACLSKPTAMTFPVLAALLEYWVVRRIRFVRLAIPAALALAVGGIASYAQGAGHATAFLAGVPFFMRLANAVAAVGFYCWHTVWPAGLATPYEHTWPELPVFLWQGAAICAAYGAALAWGGWDVISSVVHYCRSALVGHVRPPDFPSSVLRPPSSPLRSSLFIGLVWFLVAVAPTLGLANFGFHSHADRFTYLPAIGFSLILAALLSRWLRPPLSDLRPLFLAAALVALGALTWRQAGTWRTDQTLFTHTAEVTGGNYTAEQNLGIYAYGRFHDLDAAIRHFSAYLKLAKQEDFSQWGSYVLILAEAGRLEEAKAEAKKLAARVEKTERGKDYCTYIAASAIAYFSGNRKLAKEQADFVCNRMADHPDANYLLGLIARDEGRAGDAVAYWKQAADVDIQYGFLKARLR